jgi:hypothetical protein
MKYSRQKYQSPNGLRRPGFWISADVPVPPSRPGFFDTAGEYYTGIGMVWLLEFHYVDGGSANMSLH